MAIFIGNGAKIRPLEKGRKSARHFIVGTRPHSAVGNVSDNRCESDCRSRGCKFDPGPVPYFCGD